MPTFGIKYSDKPPPGAGQNVRASLDVDTGAGMAGRGLIQAGGQLQEIGQKIQDAQDSTELDTLKRKYAEARNALSSTFDTSLDAEANQKALDEFTKNMQGMQGSNGRVDKAFKSFLNSAIPQDQGTFQWANIKIRRKNVEAESQLNEQSAMERGDVSTFNTIQDKKFLLGITTQAQRDAAKDSFPTMSALIQMQRAAVSGDVATVDKINAGLDPAKMSTDQIEFAAKLVKATRADRGKLANAAVNTMILGMDANRGKTQVEKIAMGAQYRQNLAAIVGDIPEGEMRVMVDRISAWEGNRTGKSDPIIEGQIAEAAAMLNEGAKPEDFAAFDQRVLSEYKAGRLSDTDYVSYKKMGAEKRSQDASAWIGLAIADAERKGADKATFTKALWSGIRDKELKGADIFTYGQQLQLTMPKTASTDDKVQSIQAHVAALESEYGRLQIEYDKFKDKRDDFEFTIQMRDYHATSQTWGYYEDRKLTKSGLAGALLTYGDNIKALRARVPQASTTTGPIKVNNAADYAAVPSGANYIDPDGVLRKKP